MKKETYARTEMEVIAFKAEDVIMTSRINPDDVYEAERAAIQIPMI